MKTAASLLLLLFLALSAAHSFAAEREPWKDALNKAQAESQVVVVGPPDPGVRKSLTETFNQAFKKEGVTLEYQAGNLSSMGPQLDAELAARRVSIDVGISGTSLNIKRLMEPLPPRLILPAVTDLAKWKEKKFKWVDGEKQFVFQASEWITANILVNTTQVNPASIKLWKDLLKPEYKGKIAFHDPTFPGAGQAVASYLLVKLGDEYLRRLFQDQDVTTTRDYAQIVEWVARGKYPIAVATVAQFVEPFIKEGFPLKAVAHLPDAPGAKSGGFSGISLIKGAPHPNAAAVFLNWVLTREGQDALLRPQLYPSRRVDVAADYVPGYTLPKPGLEYLDTYTQEWFENRLKVQDRVIKLIGR